MKRSCFKSFKFYCFLAIALLCSKVLLANTNYNLTFKPNTRIYFGFTSKGKGLSSFGHTFTIISENGRSPFLGKAIAYSADIDGQEMSESPVKATLKLFNLMGNESKVTVSLYLSSSYLRHYYIKNQSVIIYELNADEETKAKYITKLNTDLNADEDNLPNYDILSKNCVLMPLIRLNESLLNPKEKINIAGDRDELFFPKSFKGFLSHGKSNSTRIPFLVPKILYESNQLFKYQTVYMGLHQDITLNKLRGINLRIEELNKCLKVSVQTAGYIKSYFHNYLYFDFLSAKSFDYSVLNALEELVLKTSCEASGSKILQSLYNIIPKEGIEHRKNILALINKFGVSYE